MGATGIPQGGHAGAVSWGTYVGAKCSVDGCTEPARAKGMCMSHYNKFRWAEGIRSPSYNKEALRAARLRHRYGIEVAEYDRLLAQQGGRCAICKEPSGGGRSKPHHKRLCVDHDHDSGRVRGLLCDSCNLAIGYAGTIEVLLAAVEYLRSSH